MYKILGINGGPQKNARGYVNFELKLFACCSSILVGAVVLSQCYASAVLGIP